MQVILKEDVTDLGRFGEIVDVARGYARNYLIPKGLALEATPSNINQFNAEKEAYLRKEEEKRKAAEKEASAIDGTVLTFVRKTGEEGKLYGSVTVHDIERALKEKGFDAVERKDIVLAEPIKKTGESDVEIRLHPGVKATVKVVVEPESAGEEPAGEVTAETSESGAGEGPSGATEGATEAPAEEG